MPATCAVVECSNRQNRNADKKYYTLPGVRDNQGRPFPCSIERRKRWIAALHREDLTESKIKNLRICSDHFIKGKPGPLNDPTHPDFVPTVKMGYGSKKRNLSSVVQRHARIMKRTINCLAQVPQPPCKSVKNDTLQSDDCHLANDNEGLANDNEGLANNNEGLAQETSCEKCKDKIEKLELALRTGISDICNLKKTVDKFIISPSTFENDDNKTKYYSGIPEFKGLMLIYQELFEPHITQTALDLLTPFQQFILTLMKLRLDLPFKYLGYTFNVSPQTVSRIFYKCLHILYVKLKAFIIWPERDELEAKMPKAFKDAFGNKVAVIIDCFEVFIETSSNLSAQASTWSNYKHHNTVKVLIGITPQGTTSFISNAYGGRNSDKNVTESCGILDKLLPGDIVLADRGFLIADEVQMRGATLKTPAFLKRRKQLDPQEVENTRKIASVRIHVERVIGTLRQKYKILHNLLTIDMVKKKNNFDLPVLDEILCVCCALINLCPTIAPN